jgi:hypothetical protein
MHTGIKIGYSNNTNVAFGCFQNSDLHPVAGYRAAHNPGGEAAAPLARALNCQRYNRPLVTLHGSNGFTVVHTGKRFPVYMRDNVAHQQPLVLCRRTGHNLGNAYPALNRHHRYADADGLMPILLVFAESIRVGVVRPRVAGTPNHAGNGALYECFPFRFTDKAVLDVVKRCEKGIKLFSLLAEFFI